MFHSWSCPIFLADESTLEYRTGTIANKTSTLFGGFSKARKETPLNPYLPSRSHNEEAAVVSLHQLIYPDCECG